ncbi:MAG: TetR/AcrR family transcriptional regulator [Enhygromyxa sp.]
MRTYGAKNADHEAKRAAMVAAIAPVVMRAAPERPSLREMAKAAGVSVNNLRHYFGTRDGVLEAVFAAMGIAGEPYIRRALGFTDLPAPLGLRRLLEEIVAAWTPDKLGGLHRSGISEGLGSDELGPAYVEHLLEPTLAVAERMLEIWGERGELAIAEGQLRAAGLALLAPVILALLHQRGLQGDRLRPLDFVGFIEAHVEGFLRGWG